jgi:hypothetical protein
MNQPKAAGLASASPVRRELGVDFQHPLVAESRCPWAGGLIPALSVHRQVEDPFGHRWNIAQHMPDVPHD